VANNGNTKREKRLKPSDMGELTKPFHYQRENMLLFTQPILVGIW